MGFAGSRIANDDASGRVRGGSRHARALESGRVGQGHMAIQTIHKNGSAASRRIDHLPVRQRGTRPTLVVPIAACHPPPRGHTRDELPNPFGKLGWISRLPQIDRRELQTASEEMDVGVVEAREHESAARIENPRLGTGHAGNFSVRSDHQNPSAANRHRLGSRTVGVQGAHPSVDEGEIGGERARSSERGGSGNGHKQAGQQKLVHTRSASEHRPDRVLVSRSGCRSCSSPAQRGRIFPRHRSGKI